MSADEGGRPAARGTLRERPVPRLIQQVFRKRVTGRLVITDDSGDVTRVFLREGAPVHAERPTDIDRLDRMLVASGLVSAEAVAAADEEVATTGRRLGEVLISRGTISRAVLADVLKSQIRRKVSRLFFAHDGTFEVYIEPHNFGTGEDYDLMRVDPRAFIYQGIRSAYDDVRLRKELAPLSGYEFRLINMPPNVLVAMGFNADDPTLAVVRDRMLTLDALPVAGAKPAESRAVILALLYSDLLDAHAIATAAGVPASVQDPVSAPVVTMNDRRTTWTAIPVVDALVAEAMSAAAAAVPTTANASAAAPARKAAAPGAQNAAIEGLRAGIMELHAKMDQSSHFEMLGLGEHATADEVNGAYMRVLRQYHPDRLAAAGLRDLAPQAERVMARMGEAASVLRDPNRRAEYVANRSGKKSEISMAITILDAEKIFQKGEVFLKKGDYAHAIESFSEALRGNPSEAQYRAYLAWARFEDPRARKDAIAREALATLQQVVEEQPRFARGFYWIGQIWKHLAEPNHAERAFREAVKLDKSMLEAEREVRLLEMRRARTTQTRPAVQGTAARQTGLFGKILKRGD